MQETDDSKLGGTLPQHLLNFNSNFGVLIMAAGKGTRMKSELPKVLQPLLDRPMLDYLLQSVISCDFNFNNISVLVGSGGEQVEEHIKNLNHKLFENQHPSVDFVDTFRQQLVETPIKGGEKCVDYNINILWQREQLGTGHAVKCAVDWWKDLDVLIVLNGDLPLLKPETLSELTQKFMLSESVGNPLCGPDCAVITFMAEDPASYGRVIRDNNAIKIVEFKDANERERAVKEVNAGCYFFNVKSLLKVIENLSNNNAQGEYYLPEVLTLMNDKNMKVEAYCVPEEEMTGVNTQAELAAVNKIMRGRILNFWMDQGVRIMSPETVWISCDAELSQGVVIMPNVQIWGNSKIGRNSFIGSGSILKNSIIGENCELVANVIIENSELKNSVKAGPFVYIRDNACLENNSFAGKFVEIKNSHIGEDSKVPHLSYMGDATLGKNVNIGAGTITCNYDGVNKNKTFIGDNCFVGSDTMFVAPAEIGDNAMTAAGSVITKPVPDGALAVGRARQVNIDGWVYKNNKK